MTNQDLKPGDLIECWQKSPIRGDFKNSRTASDDDALLKPPYEELMVGEFILIRRDGVQIWPEVEGNGVEWEDKSSYNFEARIEDFKLRIWQTNRSDQWMWWVWDNNTASGSGEGQADSEAEAKQRAIEYVQSQGGGK